MTEQEIFEGIHNECGNLEICTYNETGCGDCLIRQTLIKAEKALKENRPHEHNYDNCHNYTCRMRCREEGYVMAIDEFAERLKDSLLHNYTHLLNVDTDGFEWLTIDAVNTHIDRIAEQMKGK